ncbi:vWA domain-containing protein [Paenibacillus turpanensis]|uniref:vWA domain-containing protein n=1 Tax=Paenibacillus turpanensis TaxID=2689078 RepID=UPI0014097079|nr:vWA domain-containing protein [Paenibacillus turpanensis]
MSYTVLATQQNPALVVYLLDISRSMTLPMGKKRRIDVVTESLTAAVKQMVFRSTKGTRLLPRYRIAMYAYSDQVYDLLGGIRSVDEVARRGIPELIPQQHTSAALAFETAERLLEKELPELREGPAPLICHMTDGSPSGGAGDPEPVAKRLMQMAVPDGNVLIENILISDELIGAPLTDVKQWEGYHSHTSFAEEGAEKLKRMSSVIPETYRETMLDSGYRLAEGSLMLLPGSSPELVALGFQMSAATPVR